jgi:hypothetical protein
MQMPYSTSMNETQVVAALYRAATLENAWYGPSLIARVEPERASFTITPGGHSPTALLQHLLLWNDRILGAVNGTPMPPWKAEEEWAEPLRPWPTLLEEWRESRGQLEKAIKEFPPDRLGQTVPGRNYEYRHMLNGAVHHIIYHSGQIALILSQSLEVGRSSLAP